MFLSGIMDLPASFYWRFIDAIQITYNNGRSISFILIKFQQAVLSLNLIPDK